MAVILGLLIFCLGIYFLSLFFQAARLEKELADGVSLLEKYMIVTYSLDKPPKGKEGEEGGKEGGEAAPEAAPKQG